MISSSFCHYNSSSQGAFHSTHTSRNSESTWFKVESGTESFRKFVSKISVNLTRLSFFIGIWKFWIVISTPYESAPVPLVQNFCLDQSYVQDSGESIGTTLDAKTICHSSSLFCIIPGLHNPREKSSQVSLTKRVFKSVRKISRESLHKMILNTC